MNKKFFWILGGVLSFILLGSLMFNIIMLTVVAGRTGKHSTAHTISFDEVQIDGEGSGQKIAVIDLYGVIGYSVQGLVGDSMVDDIIEQLKQAREDKSIGAIIIRVDSPGGEVTASDELYKEIFLTDSKKPVVVYMNSVGASGAYYASMGARHVMANELCITASIGVIMQTINYEKLADFVGIQTITFKSGKMKDLMNPARQMTEFEKVYVQGLIDETYSKFVGIVAQRRKIDEDKLRLGVADGRIVSGKRALGDGLIDSIGYFEDAVKLARKYGNLKANCPVIRYMAPFNLSQLFRLFGEAAHTSRQVKVQIGPDTLKLESGKLYYLSPHIFAR